MLRIILKKQNQYLVYKKNENGIIKATLVKTEQNSIRERLGFLNDMSENLRTWPAFNVLLA